jgi:flagellar hook-length control protein FliK
MRIDDPPPTNDDPNVNGDDSDSRPNTDSADQSSFSRMLARKREAAQIANKSQGSPQERQGKPDMTQAEFMQSQPAPFNLAMQPSQVENKHIVTLPPELQHVVREISVAVNDSGRQQVHIELNSNVLKGLHIRVERQDAGVAIQFQSPSDHVSSLLMKNLSSLSQGLADRGVEVSNISVSGGRNFTSAQNSKQRPAPSAQSGRQGGGR